MTYVVINDDGSVEVHEGELEVGDRIELHASGEFRLIPEDELIVDEPEPADYPDGIPLILTEEGKWEDKDD